MDQEPPAIQLGLFDARPDDQSQARPSKSGWADAVFFHGGHAWGLTHQLRTVYLGPEHKVKGKAAP